MFVVPGPFVPYNDTITLLTYKRLRNLDLDMDVFAFRGKEDAGFHHHPHAGSDRHRRFRYGCCLLHHR